VIHQVEVIHRVARVETPPPGRALYLLSDLHPERLPCPG